MKQRQRNAIGETVDAWTDEPLSDANATARGYVAVPVTSTRGCHYNYREQMWVDGHDHAHMDRSGTLAYCGVDVVTCVGEQI